ncbi:hypothetical protein ACQUXI_004288 [Cronobacter turicensis]
MFDFLSSTSFWVMILALFLISSFVCKFFSFIHNLVGGDEEARTIVPFFMIMLSLVIFIVPSLYFYQKTDEIAGPLKGLVIGISVLVVAVLFIIFDIKRESGGQHSEKTSKKKS